MKKNRYTDRLRGEKGWRQCEAFLAVKRHPRGMQNVVLWPDLRQKNRGHCQEIPIKASEFYRRVTTAASTKTPRS